ncbi:hypothetical protein NBRC116585_20620 [Thalassolituus maritimus]|uniref:Transcriptional regulator SutA RNAP-binding domain-containing protein n=1 Tax=Thalassolituus maritimus TaxID=484498 RepID=A0ABQ0A0L9_9GAMM
MKKRVSKKELRDSLNQDIEQYLEKGGEVHEFDRGESGLVNGRYNEQAMSFEKRQERTPVPDVLRAIDERREARRKPQRKSETKRQSGPKKKVIYDDFGEPLRVVWED